MADQEIQFKLDLDAVEFLEKGLQVKGVIETIGDKENLTGLIEGLTQTTAVLGAVGLAVFSLKKAIDFTVEAEGIQKVQDQFQALSAQAGINGDELKESLEKAAQGLIPTNDLLKIANEKLITMGESADQLPAIMDLALKATQVYGGDATENFDNISTAIANGNSRMLKHYGILVDTQKAVKDYADANDLAENSLSKAGKTQAILNAALAQGKENFAGVEVDLGSATNTIKLLETTITELKETFVIAFENTMGSTVRSFLTGLKEAASTTKDSLNALFSDGLEGNDAKIKQTEAELLNLKGQLVDIQFLGKGDGIFSQIFKGSPDQQAEKLKAKIAQVTFNLDAYRTESKRLAAEDSQDSDASMADDKKRTALALQNDQIVQQDKIKTQKAILKSEQDTLKSQEKTINDFSTAQKLIDKNEELQEQQHQLAIQEIQNSTTTNASQKAALISKENADYAEKAKATELDEANYRKKLLDAYVQNSEDDFDAIGRAFQAHATEAKDDLDDFGKKGEETFASLQSNSVSAFEAMGAAIAQGQNIATAAGQAILKIFLGTIADRAIAEGSLHLLAGAFPPDPLELGVGAGLIALGGALKSAAGGLGGSGVSIPTATVSGSPSAGTTGGGIGGASAAKIQTDQTSQATAVASDQTQLLADAQTRNNAADTQEQANIDAATKADQANQAALAAAALATQQAATAQIAAQAQDQAAAQAAMSASTTAAVDPNATANPALAQDQQAAQAATDTTATPQKTVHINIAGNLFNTSETQRALMEMIRQETDATGFQYNQIGV